MYKLAEKTLLDEEEGNMVEAQMKALDAVVFLPDNLMEEALQDSGETNLQDNYDYKPFQLYIEQMMRIFPEEITCKLKITPAFEESFMAMNE